MSAEGRGLPSIACCWVSVGAIVSMPLDKHPLKQFAKPVHREVRIRPEVTYRTIGCRLYGNGVYARESKIGSDIRAERMFEIHSGDLVINRIWAQKGSAGVAPDELAGCVVTQDFPVWEIGQGKALPEYIGFYLRTQEFWDSCKEHSHGTSGRERLDMQELPDLLFPLPPLPEQRRIVGRIEGVAGRIVNANALRKQAANESAAIQSCVVSSILDDQRWEFRALESILAEFPRNGLSPKAEVASGGRRMLRINAVSSSPTRFVDLSAYKMVDIVAEEAKPYVLRNDDVFIVRYNGDINRVAKAAIFKGQTDAVFPDKLMRLRTRHEQMTPDFLVYALSCQGVRKQIAGMGKTTAGQVGISGTDANKFIVPVPPLSDQHRIVAKLDDLQTKMDTMKRFIDESTAALDALLPSVLDRAFKGEL